MKNPPLFKERWYEVPEGFSKENHPSIPVLRSPGTGKRRGGSGKQTFA
jgi:hypothetical protein